MIFMAIKSKFCPKCGKSIEESQESLCLDCYSSSSEPKIPRNLKIKLCPVCNSLLAKYVWIASSVPMDEVVEKYLSEKVRLPSGEKLKKLKLVNSGEYDKVEVKSNLDGKILTRILPSDLEVLKFACPQCSRQVKSSVTAKIQVRTSKNIKEFVSDVIESMRSNKALVKVEERLYGLDLSFSDKRTARVLARRLKSKFNCTIRESAKQRGFDRMKNRPLVQTTYILRQK